MKKNSNAIAIIIALLTITFLTFPLRVLIVKNEDGEIVYQQLISNGDQFTIRCIHSVEKTPVDEIYEIIDGQITLIETVYSDFGAGLPYCSFENQKFIREPGKFRITGYTLKIPRLDIRVGRYADHTFLSEKNIFKLESWEKPGKPVSFYIEKTYLFNELIKRWR